MADYFTQSCTEIPYPETRHAEVMLWRQEMIDMIAHLATEDTEEKPLPREWKHACAFVERFYSSEKRASEILCDDHAVDIHTAEGPRGMSLLFCDEDAQINLDLALQLVSAFLDFLESDDSTYVEWAFTCSKGRPGAFGGGKALVDRHHIAEIDTESLLQLKMRKLRCEADEKRAKAAGSKYRAKSYLLTFLGDDGDATFEDAGLSEALDRAASGDLLLIANDPDTETVTPERMHALSNRADSSPDFFWPDGDPPPAGDLPDVLADFLPGDIL